MTFLLCWNTCITLTTSTTDFFFSLMLVHHFSLCLIEFLLNSFVSCWTCSIRSVWSLLAGSCHTYLRLYSALHFKRSFESLYSTWKVSRRLTLIFIPVLSGVLYLSLPVIVTPSSGSIVLCTLKVPLQMWDTDDVVLWCEWWVSSTYIFSI